MNDYKVPNINEIELEMLNNMPDDYVKEVGTFTRDLIKTYTLQSFKIENLVADLHSKLDVNNLFDEELERFVKQRKGISKKNANPAKGILNVEGNGNIRIGDLFETESGNRYFSVENVEIIERGEVKIEATVPGANGNVGAGVINLIPITIQGISKVSNPSPLTDGYDKETDDSLRERYLIEIQKPATSGNIYHYMQWSREMVGVGDSKIFPLWDGNNTVQIVIIDDNKEVANQELIDRTQEYIDPKGENNVTWGTGAGQAPIGAYCTVISAIGRTIDIECTLVLEKEYELESVKPSVDKQIKEYLKSIAFKKNSVSYALMSSSILDVKGVQEWTTLTINGSQSNVLIGEKEVAILGEVNLNESQ